MIMSNYKEIMNKLELSEKKDAARKDRSRNSGDPSDRSRLANNENTYRGSASSSSPPSHGSRRALDARKDEELRLVNDLMTILAYKSRENVCDSPPHPVSCSCNECRLTARRMFRTFLQLERVTRRARSVV